MPHLILTVGRDIEPASFSPIGGDLEGIAESVATEALEFLRQNQPRKNEQAPVVILTLTGWVFFDWEDANEASEFVGPDDLLFSDTLQAFSFEAFDDFMAGFEASPNAQFLSYRKQTQTFTFTMANPRAFWSRFKAGSTERVPWAGGSIQGDLRELIFLYVNALNRWFRFMQIESGEESYDANKWLLVPWQHRLSVGARLNRNAGKILGGFQWVILERPERGNRTRYVLGKLTKEGSAFQQVKAVKARDLNRVRKRYRAKTINQIDLALNETEIFALTIGKNK